MNNEQRRERYYLRRMARQTRDRMWLLMERIETQGYFWFTPWNKSHRPEKQDELRDGLLTGLDVLRWMDAHPDWFKQGRWRKTREAFRIRLTEAGREALRNRHLYDMEPVEGGLVEPGWRCIPLPPRKAKTA